MGEVGAGSRAAATIAFGAASHSNLRPIVFARGIALACVGSEPAQDVCAPTALFLNQRKKLFCSSTIILKSSLYVPLE
jgi:hypothetical protein